MSTKRVPLSVGEVYHVYNRTVGKEIIFQDKRYCAQILNLINYYRYPQRMRFSKYKLLTPELRQNYWHSISINSALVDIYAFALMPNHYHFVLHQKTPKGIINFISNLQNSFAKYFNTITSRTGGLFQDRFKARLIRNEKELKHVIRYTHLNPVTSNLIELENLDKTAITSHVSYIQRFNFPFIEENIVLKFFSSVESYEKFIDDNADYQKKLHEIKKLLFD